MTKPETLASAMAEAFGEIEGATKDKVNPHFKAKYADLGSVMDAIKPALTKRGLFYTQRCQPSEDGVIVQTVLHHASGEEMDLGSLYVPANKRDAQGFGSALTYARRYALMTAFGVPAEDDDGNAASRSNNEKEPVARAKLDGPHTSKTALREAVNDITAKLRAAQSLDELKTIIREAQPTIRQAQKDWPILISGNPEIPEDVGLDGAYGLRRAELDPDNMVSRALADMKETAGTPEALDKWLGNNAAFVETLDGADARRFQNAYDAYAADLTLRCVNAG